MGLISHRAHPSTGHTYGFRVTLASDKSAHSMVLPLKNTALMRTPKKGHGCSSTRIKVL